jgi:hypothetical protein
MMCRPDETVRCPLPQASDRSDVLRQIVQSLHSRGLSWLRATELEQRALLIVEGWRTKPTDEDASPSTLEGGSKVYDPSLWTGAGVTRKASRIEIPGS